MKTVKKKKTTKTSNKTNKHLSKKDKIILTVASILVVCQLVLYIVLPILLFLPKDTPFQPPELSLPVEENYALTKYNYEDLGDVKVTVRADAMNVTKRNILRTTPEILSDDFSLVYNTDENKLFPYYGDYNVTDANKEKVAKISFNPENYPEPYYRKGSSTQNVYADAALKAGQSEADYFTYYKYMYMTQGQHLAKEASWRSALTASDSDEIDQDFANWLKKHPSADGQYGAVKGSDNAVEKEITLDPLYRSLHTTGLYMPAGEPVTVKVEGLKQGESISVVLGSTESLAWRGSVPAQGTTDISNLTNGKNYNQVNYANPTSDYFFKQADLVTVAGKFFNYNHGDTTPFLQSQWKRQNARAPWLACTFTLSENKTYTLGFAYGGLLQISMNNCYSNVKTTIKGAVETPHYILGVTTPDYFDTYLRNAPGVMAALDTENGILTGPTGELGNSYCANMRNVTKDEIDKLATLWHSFLSVDESFTGGTYNRFNKVNFDWHVPAGAAVSLGGYTFAHPTGWFSGAMNYQGLLRSGAWGILHEIGHNHASAYGVTWGFGTGQEGEVRNNALTLLAYIMSCDIGTTIRMGGSAEHGGYANPYSTLREAIANKGKMSDFNEAGYWRALGMYSNIMHSFGAEKYYELLYTYKLNPSYSTNKRADFAYRCSKVYGMNFLPYFNEFYGANITDIMFSEEQLAEMKALPNYQPVACFYAGGVDGVKTAGDYVVSYGDDIIFDLEANTISTLDTADKKGFKIISVEKPKYGSIRKTSDGKWAYSFSKKYTGPTDEFSFKIKLDDGIIHRFTITLRISSYNSSRISRYTELEAPVGSNTAELFDNITEQISNKTPEYLNSYAGAGVPTYNTGSLEARTSDFWWKAPVTGEVALMIGGTSIRLYTGKDFDNLEATNLVFSTSVNPNNTLRNPYFKYVMKVEKDKSYAIRLMTTNNGRVNSNISGGVYVLQKDGEVVASETMDDNRYLEFVEDGASYGMIPTSQIYHTNYPTGKEFETFVFTPQFIVSKKDNVKLSVTGTDKTQWEVVKAPEYIHGGRYYDEIQYLIPVDENGQEIPGAPREEFHITHDKWDYLIDGETGTSLHTQYTGSYVGLSEEHPHEFIIDTKEIQDMNYFAVTTRNNVNSYIEKYELYLAKTQNADGSYDWHKIAEGDRSDYEGTTITVSFNEQQARYLRLVVKKTSGGSFSVLSEIDAGIHSPTQKLISLSSSKLFTTKGWQSTNNIDTEPSGYLLATKKNEKAVIKFKGDSVSLYASTGVDYGGFTVIIDGKNRGKINLDSETIDSRKLVFYAEDLSNKEHTMEIITNNAGKVMLNVAGLPYSASLLNASNIYLERALTISLIVFVLLFAMLFTLTMCLLFIPKFRKFMGDNKAIAWLDKKLAEDKLKRQEKRKLKKANKQQEKSTSTATVEEKKPQTTKETNQKTTKKAQPVKESVKSATKPKTQPKPANVKTSPKSTSKPTATKSTVSKAKKK